MKERSREEILKTMCAPEPTDDPQEGDFEPRSAEDERADSAYVRLWIAKEAN